MNVKTLIITTFITIIVAVALWASIWKSGGQTSSNPAPAAPDRVYDEALNARLGEELLQDTTFSQGTNWNYRPGVEVAAIGIIVDTTSIASQIVDIVPSKMYFLNVKAICPNEDAQGRRQINWLDKNSKFISFSIEIFECTDFIEVHFMEARAPDNASKAVVYATSHSVARINIQEISLTD
ncbi:MAG: hypothetical protein JKX99_07135 [Robiginitomaculum sp.]|nr:hypothetical protein [Robiginitomaculum sp.]